MPGPREMDKLRRVLSGQDAEDPSPLSEVSSYLVASWGGGDTHLFPRASPPPPRSGFLLCLCALCLVTSHLRGSSQSLRCFCSELRLSSPPSQPTCCFGSPLSPPDHLCSPSPWQCNSSRLTLRRKLLAGCMLRCLSLPFRQGSKLL